MDEDEDVRILDARKESLERQCRDSIAWPTPETNSAASYAPVPCTAKVILVLAWLLAHCSVLGFLMAGAGPITVALEKVDLLTNMTLPPFEGEITNVVRAPAGYIVHSIWACGLFFGLGIF
eukprot:SAG31_NODE_25256_length_465_cov_0.554645_1_plen_120_part_01